MGKRVYGSGRSAGDLVEDRPASDNNLAEIGGRIGAPVCDEATRAVAAQGVRRRCSDADLILDALGLLPKLPAKRTARTFDCPTCGSRSGAVCKDSNSTPMKRFHVARNKALTRWLKEQAADTLIDSLLDESEHADG